jgi:hypothetical protein
LAGEPSGPLEWRLQTGLGQRLPQRHQYTDDVLARAADGLVHLVEPLADYFFQFLDDYRHNARQLFGCRGIFLPISMGTHGQMRHGTHAPMDSWSRMDGAALVGSTGW